MQTLRPFSGDDMMGRLRQIGMLAVLVLATWTAKAEDKKVDLKVGDPAPVFEAQDDTGKTWKSSDVVGKKILVVYFYPADFTGGCTKQACGFRDDMKKLEEKDVVVVGVSGDSVRTHEQFKKAESLNFTLLADGEGKVANAFGVPFTKGEKTAKAVIDGKEEMVVRSGTAQRWTFMIDRDGKIALKNTQVKAAEDSKAILEKVEELQ
jgi:peroxiredoxin Q/BCP